MGNNCSTYNHYLDDMKKKHINLNPGEVRRNNETLRLVINKLILELKETSRLFKSCYQDLYFSGSYYDGLRISAPTEYDINLILSLPFNYYDDLNFEPISNTYCEMSFSKAFERVMPRSHPRYDDFKDIPKHFLSVSLFEADKVHRWFRGLVTRALNNGMNDINYGDRIEISYSVKNSGPAHTFKVKRNGESAFEINLVPVFENPSQSVFLVPKQPDEDEILKYEGCSDYLWRISYTRKEREDLVNPCAKTVIKMLKLLRNKQSWNKLKSYYIKIAVVHLNVDSWSEGNLANHLCEAAENLQKHLFAGKLPSLHDKNHNLFAKVSQSTWSNYGYRLQKIISKVGADPKELYAYLDQSELVAMDQAAPPPTPEE